MSNTINLEYNPCFMDIAVSAGNISLTNPGCGPFGACLAYNNELVEVGNNRVVLDNDPTQHAEINTIRKACKKLGTFDLTGYVLYSSCQPCPMCLAACHWARISRVYYVLTKEDAASLGFIDDDLYDYFKNYGTESKLNMDLIRVNHETAKNTFIQYKGLIY